MQRIKLNSSHHLRSFYVVKTALIAQNKTSKPNIIIVFTDDQGIRMLAFFGSPLIKTPNLDKMAENGIKFTDFYSASSVVFTIKSGIANRGLPT